MRCVLKNNWWFALLAVSIFACTKVDDNAPTPFEVNEPEQFPKMVIPADNPLTEEGVALGRRLFFDPILSKDSSLACASCHLPKGGFTDNQAVSTGVTGATGKRSAMALVNLGYNTNGFFWDGRVATLEEQALVPVEDPVEMHESWQNVIGKLQQVPPYPGLFYDAFGTTEITKELVAKALAQFERTLVSVNAKYDQVVRGEAVFTESEQRGFQIFMDDAPTLLPEGECGHCHISPLFTTNEYHNNGIEKVADTDDFPDKGRGAVTGYLNDNGKFRVPTLRNISATGPYMHDGRFATLEEVVEHYNSGGHHSENKSSNVLQLNLSEQDKADMIAFLKTLTDTTFLENPAFAKPIK